MMIIPSPPAPDTFTGNPGVCVDDHLPPPPPPANPPSPPPELIVPPPPPPNIPPFPAFTCELFWLYCKFLEAPPPPPKFTRPSLATSEIGSLTLDGGPPPITPPVGFLHNLEYLQDRTIQHQLN